MNYLFIISLLLIIVCICNMKKNVIYEKFSKVGEQKDVDINDRCLVPKNEGFPKLSQINLKVEQCFKDNENIVDGLKDIEKYFAVFLTEVFLSDTTFYNVFNLNELQTNVKSFRVLIYNLFDNTKFIKDPVNHNLIKGRVESAKDALNMMKQILLYGNRKKLGDRIEPIDGFQYKGLKDLYNNYITIFTRKDIKFEEVFSKVFVKKPNYKLDFDKHYKLIGPFDELDEAIKRITSINKFPFNITNFNNYIMSVFGSQVDFQAVYKDGYTFDVTRQQGYYYLRTEIEMWKKLIEHNNGLEKEVAEEMLNYYDKGKNNRREIFKKLVQELYHGEDKNIFGRWDDENKRYEHDAALKQYENNENYSNMRRIYHNIQIYSIGHIYLFEMFNPNPLKSDNEKLILRPECESMPDWDI